LEKILHVQDIKSLSPYRENYKKNTRSYPVKEGDAEETMVIAEEKRSDSSTINTKQP